ncbi:hypothetical protein [Bacillus sp. FSL M8-0350]|uniref:hypothetical protein n=1 Tax=Bacillus sp. FSL M8-0350 TaxID=2954579 RepID=UPI00315A27D8
MNEAIQFLRRLQQELKTQDVDCQAAPRFWVVGDYKWVEANGGNAERYSVYLPNAAESYPVKDYIENAKEDGEFSGDQLKELDECNNDYDEILEWIQKYEDEGAELFPEKKVHIKKDNTFFITKEEAKKHIKANSHHYTSEAHTYAMTAWRAAKVAKLWEILQEFDWESVEIKKEGTVRKEKEQTFQKRYDYHISQKYEAMAGNYADWSSNTDAVKHHAMSASLVYQDALTVGIRLKAEGD